MNRVRRVVVAGGGVAADRSKGMLTGDVGREKFLALPGDHQGMGVELLLGRRAVQLAHDRSLTPRRFANGSEPAAGS